MLLNTYTIEIFNSECNPLAITVHCFAHLDQDIEPVLPYLNSVLGGFEYTKNPPALAFKLHGKLIAVYPRKIAVNALKDEIEARKIIEWLKREINDAWGKRSEIKPSYEGIPKPKVIEILKLLPQTNCGTCGEATCMVFATRVAEGVKCAGDCSTIEESKREKLENYTRQFKLDD